MAFSVCTVSLQRAVHALDTKVPVKYNVAHLNDHDNTTCM